MRAEYEALRKVARVADRLVATPESSHGTLDWALLNELREALLDLEDRFAYLLEPRLLGCELQGLVAGEALEPHCAGAESLLVGRPTGQQRARS